MHNENLKTHHLAPHDVLSLGMHISKEDMMLFACISMPFRVRNGTKKMGSGMVQKMWVGMI